MAPLLPVLHRGHQIKGEQLAYLRDLSSAMAPGISCGAASQPHVLLLPLPHFPAIWRPCLLQSSGQRGGPGQAGVTAPEKAVT